MKRITLANYQKDPLYAGVAKAVAEILATTNVVTPLEVLLRQQRLTKQQVEDWRFGRIPFLERVCLGNLAKMSRILRILDLHSRTLSLTPSQTVYHKWGRGGKHIVLRFSKSDDPALEAAYSRHYLAQPRGSVGQPRANVVTAESSEDPPVIPSDASAVASHAAPRPTPTGPTT